MCRSSITVSLKGAANLGDTLSVLSAVERGPSYPARVLALEEQRFGLAILKAEDLAVASDIELALCIMQRSAIRTMR